MTSPIITSCYPEEMTWSSFPGAIEFVDNIDDSKRNNNGEIEFKTVIQKKQPPRKKRIKRAVLQPIRNAPKKVKKGIRKCLAKLDKRCGKAKVRAVLEQIDHKKFADRKEYQFIGRPNTYIVEKKGELAGDYELGRILGEGGFGKVYETPSNSLAAIKVFRKRKMRSTHQLKRTNREIGLLKCHGHHPNITSLLDVMHARKNIYIVMEKGTMDLFTLYHFTNVFQVQPDALQQVMTGILRGVKYLHERGICHRDLKLENILVCTSDLDKDNNLIPGGRIEARQIRLCDFGLAEFSENYNPEDVDEVTYYGGNGMNQWYDIILFPENWAGTPSFTAPELLLEDWSEGRIADMWSVGCIFMVLARLRPNDWSLIESLLLEGRGSYDYDELIEDLIRKGKKQRICIAHDQGMCLLHDLIFGQLLTMDVSKRHSAEQALQHPWFRYHCPRHHGLDTTSFF